jgi:hypothetical protein
VGEFIGMWCLCVGKPFAEERKEWPPGSIEYRYFNGNHLLQMCEAQLTPSKIRAFEEGPVRGALYAESDVIFFSFKIEGYCDWVDQGFSIHLVDAGDRNLVPLIEGTHIPLNLVLVDAVTGVVRSMRMVTYGRRFSAVLHRHLAQQLAQPFDAAHHRSVIDRVYRRYRTGAALARAALITERLGSQTA